MLLGSGESFREALKGDVRYEVKEPTDYSNAIFFRLTGYTLYGLSKEQALNVYGVNLNKMNEMLIKNINSASGTWFVAGEYDDDHQFWLVFDQVREVVKYQSDC